MNGCKKMMYVPYIKVSKNLAIGMNNLNGSLLTPTQNCVRSSFLFDRVFILSRAGYVRCLFLLIAKR